MCVHGVTEREKDICWRDKPCSFLSICLEITMYFWYVLSDSQATCRLNWSRVCSKTVRIFCINYIYKRDHAIFMAKVSTFNAEIRNAKWIIKYFSHKSLDLFCCLWCIALKSGITQTKTKKNKNNHEADNWSHTHTYTCTVQTRTCIHTYMHTHKTTLPLDPLQIPAQAVHTAAP